jgi:hypothetical protein
VKSGEDRESDETPGAGRGADLARSSLAPIAVLVDAGWLLATAAREVLGTPYRDELQCHYRGLVGALEALVDRHSGGLPRLRTYWYDAAPNGSATYEHDRIAGLPFVKLRLGRLNSRRQPEGVGLLIYHDLVTLARARAVGRIYLLAREEGLREAVAAAQTVGVQVVLVGLSVENGSKPSARHFRECDEYLTLPGEVWRTHCSRRPEDAGHETSHDEVAGTRRAGDAFARQWAGSRSRSELGALLADFPVLPRDLDIELLIAAEEELGSLRERPDLKVELRGAFWLALKEIARGAEPGSGE